MSGNTGGRIFVSYRRDDSADATGRIFDRLESHFGRRALFLDIDSIPFGADFPGRLAAAIEETVVLLAVIGDAWLTPERDTGARRIDDPGDYVRLEIEAALDRGVTVIPVLVGGAQMPPKEDLPESLQRLAFRNAAEVRSGRDFDQQVERLVQALVGAGAGQRRSRRFTWILGLLVLVIAIVAAAAMFGLPGDGDAPATGPGEVADEQPEDAPEPPMPEVPEVVGPVVSILSPPERRWQTGSADTTIEGRVEPADVKSLLVGGESVRVKSDGSFSHLVMLEPWKPVTVEIVAEDFEGQTSNPIVRVITYEPDPGLWAALVQKAVEEAEAERWREARAYAKEAERAGAPPEAIDAEVRAGVRRWEAGPQLIVLSPLRGATVETLDVEVRGRLENMQAGDAVRVNGQLAMLSAQDFTARVSPEKSGAFEIRVEVKNGSVARDAATVVIQFRYPLQVALDGLASGDAEETLEALEAVTTLPLAAPRVLPLLPALLESEDARLRAAACNVLAALGKPDRQTVAPLLELQYDPDPIVAAAAFDGLERLNPSTSIAKRVVLPALQLDAHGLPFEGSNAGWRTYENLGDIDARSVVALGPNFLLVELPDGGTETGRVKAEEIYWSSVASGPEAAHARPWSLVRDLAELEASPGEGWMPVISPPTKSGARWNSARVEWMRQTSSRVPGMVGPGRLDDTTIRTQASLRRVSHRGQEEWRKHDAFLLDIEVSTPTSDSSERFTVNVVPPSELRIHGGGGNRGAVVESGWTSSFAVSPGDPQTFVLTLVAVEDRFPTELEFQVLALTDDEPVTVKTITVPVSPK